MSAHVRSARSWIVQRERLMLAQETLATRETRSAARAFERPLGAHEAGPLAALARQFGHVKRLELSPLWFRRLGRVGLHAGLIVLAELATALAAEGTVRRRVRQANSGRIPFDAFRVTLSGVTPLV